jgi:hypothetical protein
LEEVGELEKANERYKNQRFKNKALQKSNSTHPHHKSVAVRSKNEAVVEIQDKNILQKNPTNSSHNKNK